jgi:hypothetical protein
VSNSSSHLQAEFDTIKDAALLQSEQVLKLASPANSEYAFLRFWLDWEQGGRGFLMGIESEPYDQDHTDDLISLSPTAAKDPLAQRLSDLIVPLYHRYLFNQNNIPMDQDLGSIWNYKYYIFVLLGDAICAVLASIIPIISICLLYYIQSMFKKLVIAIIMNFSFSFIMAVVIRGRRVDVFAASTAFAAVQVVFIGGVSYILKEI